jgi:hypothetical protein
MLRHRKDLASSCKQLIMRSGTDRLWRAGEVLPLAAKADLATVNVVEPWSGVMSWASGSAARQASRASGANGASVKGAVFAR